MAGAVFSHFDEVLSHQYPKTVHLDFERLGIPQVDLPTIDSGFSEEEVWQTIQDTPLDKAPGPDGFTGLFYRIVWPIIKQDIMHAFHALWSLDGRSFYLLNQAFMILLRKKCDASQITDYRPISLIHSFSKFFTKALATRLPLP